MPDSKRVPNTVAGRVARVLAQIRSGLEKPIVGPTDRAHAARVLAVLTADPLDEKAVAHLADDIRAGINSTDPVDRERATIALEALELELRSKWAFGKDSG